MFDNSEYSIKFEATDIGHLPLYLKHIYTIILCAHRHHTQASFRGEALLQRVLASVQKTYMQLHHVGLCLYLISNTRWLFPCSSRGRKSIGRIIMLLSVLLPRLYIHCHQFTTQPLDLNLSFYSSALLFICNSCGCGGERTRVYSLCVCVSARVRARVCV